MFELQGHRGARGLKPENTLPGFETAFDLGVNAVETDIHLTRDAIPILFHDPHISERLCRRRNQLAPPPSSHPRISTLSLAELRGYRADRNPDRHRFPTQDRSVTPLARLFAQEHRIDPFTLPTLAELFLFAEAYAGALGQVTGKTPRQRTHLRTVKFDLELKCVPFRPELTTPAGHEEMVGVLEKAVLDVVRSAGMLDRTTLRSFDHRTVRAIRDQEPRLTTAILVAGTAPVDPAELALRAGATLYCPEFEFVDPAQIQQCHAAGVRVIPWTVNDEADALRLLGWGVDGLTTDYPDRLAVLLAR